MDEQNKDINHMRSVAMRAEKGSVIIADGAKISGYQDVIIADSSSIVSVKNSMIKRIPEVELDLIKTDLLKEIEKIIADAKKGRTDKMEYLINFISQVGSGTLLGYLKSQGYIE